MSLYTFGINHKTAPVLIREKLAFSEASIEPALKKLVKYTAATEAAIISTCNRSEIYCVTSDIEEVAHWFSDFHKIDYKEIKPYIYIHTDIKCVQHMLRVTSGLDSLILGEPQILGQMKVSCHNATKAATLGKKLNRLFQHSFRVAKQIRTDTEIGSSPVSVAFATVTLAKKIFGDINDKSVMLIGAGETIELVARHLNENNISNVIVANRSFDRAHNLAALYNGFAIGLPEIASHLHQTDIVISSTASPLPIIGKGVVESALKKRKHKPMFMVDIAVPRDIETEVNQLEDVFLFTVDDLHDVITENMKSRQNAAIQAEEIVDIQTQHYWDWLESQQSIATIQNYRNYAHKVKQELIEKAMQSLDAGKDPKEILEVLAHRLTNQLLHEPCSNLRQAKNEEQLALINAAKTLFNIN